MALIKNKINFQEQKMFYEKPGDIYPKYVVDFYLTNNQRNLIVECDGFSFHSSDKDINRDIVRDQWFRQRKYSVKRFTKYQIEHELNTVILIIKKELGLEQVSKKQIRFYGKKIAHDYIYNVSDKNLHNVELFYYGVNIKQNLFVSYKFRDNTVNKFSEERSYIVKNVPNESSSDLAVYLALRDLKCPTNLIIYCPSEWLTNYFNKIIRSKQEIALLKKTENILQSHNYLFKYINIVRNINYYETVSDERFILEELKSNVNQKIYSKEHVATNVTDYDKLISES